MLDTGVDAPRILNLVFFKPVKSYSKFWQMIGRGTRLCPDIFGPGQDKEFFLIFDYCRNLEFFEENPDGYQSSQQRSLSQMLFLEQVYVANLIQQNLDASGEDMDLATEYLNRLHQQVASLDTSRYEVRKYLASVHRFSNRSVWNDLSQSDILLLETEISSLIPYTDDTDEMAKRFDLTSYKLQRAVLDGSPRQTTVSVLNKKELTWEDPTSKSSRSSSESSLSPNFSSSSRLSSSDRSLYFTPSLTIWMGTE